MSGFAAALIGASMLASPSTVSVGVSADFLSYNVNTEVQLSKHFNVYAGIGDPYWFHTFAFTGGVRYHFLNTRVIRPYVGAQYGWHTGPNRGWGVTVLGQFIEADAFPFDMHYIAPTVGVQVRGNHGFGGYVQVETRAIRGYENGLLMMGSAGFQWWLP